MSLGITNSETLFLKQYRFIIAWVSWWKCLFCDPLEFPTMEESFTHLGHLSGICTRAACNVPTPNCVECIPLGQVPKFQGLYDVLWRSPQLLMTFTIFLNGFWNGSIIQACGINFFLFMCIILGTSWEERISRQTRTWWS